MTHYPEHRFPVNRYLLFPLLALLLSGVAGCSDPKEKASLSSLIEPVAFAGVAAPAAQHQNQAESDFNAEAMFDAGLKAVAGNDLARGDFLTKMAMRRQADQPATVGPIWIKFQDYLGKQKLPPDDRLTRLLAYLDSVEAALRVCRKHDDFEQVWGVRQKVLVAVQDAQNALRDETGRELADFQKNMDAQTPLAAVRAFEEVRAKLEPRLALLLSSSESATPTEVSLLKPVTRKLVAVAAHEASRFDKEINDLAEQGQVKGGKVELAKEESEGPCEKLLHQMQEFSSALEHAQLHRLLLLSKDADAQAKLFDLTQNLARLHARVAKLQQIRYNLWAVRQIYAAENVKDWDVYLGRIDVGMLHPVTAALYAPAYDSRIKKVDDPITRIRMVQQILNRKKVALTSF